MADEARAELLAEAEQSPPWVKEAIANAAGEVRLFVRTLARVTLRPRAFARDWASRRTPAMNPLAFVATCASLLAALGQAYRWVGVPLDAGGSFLADVGEYAKPFAFYAATGLVAHLVMVPFGRRRRVLDSVAVGLYAGGPALLGYALVTLVVVAAWLYEGRPASPGGGLAMAFGMRLRLFFWAGAWGVILVFVRALWSGLVALHGRRALSALAVLVAMVTIGLASGWLGVRVGLTFVIQHFPAGGWYIGPGD
jgi:hypothetical protein